MPASDYLTLAARLALRGAGDVEPNPMVGAVIVKNDQIIGLGHHRKYGGLHAEREALADCLRRGNSPRGSTLYVTLEPCCHHGKQPPCTDAMIEAGISRVVAARPDPNPVSSNGAQILGRAGIPCDFTGASPLATRLSDPFIRRTTLGLPWIIAKWAQTPDGRLKTNPGEPRWISGEPARRRVHRLRARVDAVLTGIGTALADDPLLTPRHTRIHRTPRRIILDPALRLPPDSQLARTVRQSPVLVVCDPARLAASPNHAPLRSAGVELLPFPHTARGPDLPALLRSLAVSHHLSTILLESGPTLLQSMLAADLVDAALVHIGGGGAMPRSHWPAAAAQAAPALAVPARFTLCRSRISGPDAELLYARSTPPPAPSAPPAA